MEARRAGQQLRKKGLAQLVFDAMHRFIPGRSFDLGKMHIYVRVLEAPEPGDEDLEVPPELRYATLEDAEAIGALRMGADAVRRRLAEGQRCAVLYEDGRVIASSWSRSEFGMFAGWLRVRLREGDRFGYDLEVQRELRGQRVADRMRPLGLRNRARNPGQTKRSVSCVDASNRSSLRRQVRRDRTPAGRIYYVRLLGYTLVHIGGRLRVGHWTNQKPLEASIDDLVSAGVSEASATGGSADPSLE